MSNVHSTVGYMYHRDQQGSGTEASRCPGLVEVHHI